MSKLGSVTVSKKVKKTNNLLKKLSKSKNVLKMTKKQKLPGHWEGKFWVWGDKKKTHVNFIRMSITTKRAVPPGFYEACEKSKDAGVIKMGKVAKKFGCKELK